MKFLALILSFIGLNSAFANHFSIEKWQTKNGVQVLFYQAKEVPMLDISLAFAAGSAYDGPHYGLSALTAEMLNQGSAGKSASDLAQDFAEQGSQFSIETNRDMAVLTLRTLSNPKALQSSVKTLTQILKQPDFPENSFNNQKKQTLMAIAQAGESPNEVAKINFFNKLYQNHPYAHSVQGTQATVSKIKKQQVQQFYKQFYVASNATLVLVGAIEKKDAQNLAEQITQGLPKGQAAPSIPKASQIKKAEQVHIDFPSSQTVVFLGQIGIDYQNPNYYPLMVGNYILGGGTLVSRLGYEVREKRGLTYGITSQFTPMPGTGPSIISLSTRNNQLHQAVKITEETLNLFLKEGPNEQELDSAKQYLTGSFPLSLGSNKAIATLLLHMAFYHLPDNFLEDYASHINEVTIGQIKQAFKEQIQPDKLLLVTVGQT